MMICESQQKALERNMDTENYIVSLKKILGDKYEEFIMDNTLDIFESIKKNTLKYKDLKYEINNYESFIPTIDVLLGSRKIIWTIDAFDMDLKENLKKLKYLGVKDINFQTFEEIIKFLLLEKALLFELDDFRKVAQYKKDLYYNILENGIENSKEKIKDMMKMIKKCDKKILDKIEKLDILEDKSLFANMKIISSNKYKGLDFQQFIYQMFPELLFLPIEKVKEIVEHVEEEEANKEIALSQRKSFLKIFKINKNK